MNEEIPTKPIFDAPGRSEASNNLKKPPLTIKKSLVYAGIIVILVIMGFTVIMAKLINENSQCISNPFIYGASTIESTRGEPHPQCVCVIEEGTTCMCALANNGVFWFDDKEVYLENPLLN